MNEILMLVLIFVGGLIMGIIFFGGLWLTVLNSTNSRAPGLWFAGSFIVRTAIALTGFYYLGGGQWQHFLSCLLGFVAARIITIKLTRLPRADKIMNGKEGHHET